MPYKNNSTKNSYPWAKENPLLQSMFKRGDDVRVPSHTNLYRDAVDAYVNNLGYNSNGSAGVASKKASTFREGLDVWGRNFTNDMKYIGASLRKGASGEDYYPEVIASLQERYGGNLLGQSDAQLRERMNEVKRENYQVPFPVMNPSHSISVAQPRNPKYDAEYDLLSGIINMRENGETSKDIEEWLNTLYQSQGEATQKYREVLSDAEQIPETEGWGTVANMSASVAEGVLPVLGATINPAIGFALGGVSIGKALTQSAAQANKEIDLYEKNRSVSIPKASRDFYVSGVTATDAILGGLMQTRYLKNIDLPMLGSLRKSVLDKITKNSGAVNEFNHLLRRSFKESIPSVLKNSGRLSVEQAAASGASAVSRNIFGMVYENPQDYPHLSEIIRDVATEATIGAGTGLVTGGVASGVGLLTKPRAKGFKSYHLNLPDEKPLFDTGGLSLRDYLDREAEIKRILGDRYRPADVDLGAQINHDRIWQQRQPRKELSNSLRSSAVKSMGDKLNIKTVMYADVKDVPDNYKKYMDDRANSKGFYNPETGEVAIIGDNIRSSAELQNILIQKGYGDAQLNGGFGEEINSLFDDVYRNMTHSQTERYGADKPSREVAKHYLADLAENPDINPSEWRDVSTFMRELFASKLNVNNLSDETIRGLFWRMVNSISSDDTIDDMIRKSAGEATIKRGRK